MPEASWLEASLTVDGELIESVAEVFSRFIPDGVVVESTDVSASLDDSEAHTVGPLRIYGYLPVDHQLEATRRRLEEALWYLGRIRPLPEVQFRFIGQTDWSEAWKQHYRPIAVGKRLMVIPAWMEPPYADRIPIRIDPGMAFGTGTHPTTQLCLEILESQALRFMGASSGSTPPGTWEVIDLGCGTAILAIAALKLGARRALGVDIDADAIRAARENAETNGVADLLELGLGSLVDIRSGAFSLQKARLVLANLLSPVLIRLLEEGLCELITPNGHLVLSGILSEQTGDIENAATRHGLSIVDRRQVGDWLALCCQSIDRPDREFEIFG